MWFKMNFQVSLYSVLLLPCHPQRKVCIFRLHLSLPLEKMPLLLDCFPSANVGTLFCLFGVFVSLFCLLYFGSFKSIT